MKFVLTVIASVAICLATGTMAEAQSPYGYGPTNGAVRQAPYGTIGPKNVQRSWGGAVTPTANHLLNGIPSYSAPSAVTKSSYGQPVMQSFTPMPNGQAQAANSAVTQGDMSAPVMAPIPGAAHVAPTGGFGGYGGGCGGACGPTSSVTAQPIYGGQSYMQAMAGPCVSGGPVIPVQPAVAQGCPKWFGGVYGLIMDRDGDDEFFLLHNRADPRLTFLDAGQADMDVTGGVEARIGRTFCNCRWGLEGVYWGLFPDDQSAQFNVPLPVANPYDMVYDLTNVWLNLEDPLTGPYRDGAENQFHTAPNGIRSVRVDRSFEYHNVEINLLSGPLTPAGGGGGCGRGRGGCGGGGGGYGMSGPAYGCGDGCGGYYGGDCYGACATTCGPRPRLNVGWLFGVRFFKLDESVSIFADAEDGVYGVGDPNFEYRHDIATENNLVGVQLGMHLDYYLTKCLHLEAGSKFGFYGNHMKSKQNLYNGFGDAYIPVNGTDVDFDFESSEDDIAYLGELRLGLGYKLSCNFRLTGGYRVVAASGVALPLDQIVYGQQFAAPTAYNNINNNGQLVLHGAYAGLEFAW